MGNLYSIGHSKHDPLYFLKLLREYNINYVLDVRSTPYSKFAPWYNKEQIKMFLEQNNIFYCPMGKFFGARQEDRSLYSPTGFLDFDKVSKQQFFIRGKESVKRGMIQGNTIAFMCTEKDPIDCHRAILVSKAFMEDDIITQHILSDGSLQSQTMLEQRLLNKYFPDRAQLSFVEPKKSEEQLIKECYIKRNAEIGFHYEEEV